MTKMIKLTINDQIVEVPEGTTVMNAASTMGVTIPRYCYHPALPIAGNCRICLVDIEGSPKLQISCHTQVREGMVVRTESEKAKHGRQGVLEFLLANHPLDCPVCDQSGECRLQDYYMEHGLYNGKFLEQKVKKSKAVVLGPTVMLDTERCILCSVCTRFCEEVTKTNELGIFNRGDHSIVGLYPGKELNNKYSGNVVDICPVGALTDRDFRFKCRVWYLAEQESVCNGCARGCNINIHWNQKRPYQTPDERVMRLKPRYNADVNQWWICDAGRYGYKSIDENRIPAPMKRDNGTLIQAEWSDVLADVCAFLETAKLTGRQNRVAVLASPQLTNEDLFVLKKFCAQWGIEKVALVSPHPSGDQDDLLIRADKNPNRKGAEAIWGEFTAPEAIIADAASGALDGLLIFGQDLEALYGSKAASDIQSAVKMIIFQGAHRNATSTIAHVVLPSAVYAEKDGTFTNFQGRVQRIRPAFPPMGSARGDWEILQSFTGAPAASPRHGSSEEIFNVLAAENGAFAGLSYESIGSNGARMSVASGSSGSASEVSHAR